MALGLGGKLACALALLSAAGGAVAAVASCLPDLAAAPADAGREGGSLCGNGFIDVDAGERCDPGGGGDAGTPGCTSTCQIACADGGGFVDPATDHCYFLLSSGQQLNAGATNTKSGCPSPENAAHVVTFVSEIELDSVTGSTLFSNGLIDRYWVGLRFAGNLDGGQHEWVSEYAVEPGWAGQGACPGCYANAAAGANGFKSIDEAGAGCVEAPKSAPGAVWLGASCPVDLAHVICEREPPGSRAALCADGSGNWCITLEATLGTKSYQYHPAPMTPPAAERACKAVADGGPRGTLVVFETSEEREQLLHELLNLPGASAPPQFWIGLSRDDGTDAASPWTWDDLQPLVGAYPLPWGIGAPETPGGARAYVQEDGVSADTQLTHTAALANAPFVCQY